MCGRTAQTNHAVRAAAEVFGAAQPRRRRGENEQHQEENHHESAASGNSPRSSSLEWTDNYNLSPGMDAMVIWRDEGGNIQVKPKTWGLVTRGGTVNKPILEGMSKHFEGLMFNARSDTLWDKPTFARLLAKRQTCLVAVDGFFEWKTELGHKQPYFLYRHKSATDRPFLLLAGLWASVPTGRSESPTLDTFTILTTDACDELRWIHSRMPVFVWNDELAMQWLRAPSRSVTRQLVEEAATTTSSQIQWHAVSSKMSNVKYRDADAMAPISQTKSVKTFFQKMAAKESPSIASKTTDSASGNPDSHTTKRSAPVAASPSRPTSAKKQKSAPKKGSIASFFSPKK